MMVMMFNLLRAYLRSSFRARASSDSEIPGILHVDPSLAVRAWLKIALERLEERDRRNEE